MADKKAKPNRSDKKHSPAALYGRIAFYTVVVAAIVVILLIRQDRVVQNAYAETTKLWADALEAANDEDQVLRKSALPDPVGNPVESEMIDGSDSPEAGQHQTYTWKGIFNSYVAVVNYGGGDDPIVVDIPNIDDATKDAETDE